MGEWFGLALWLALFAGAPFGLSGGVEAEKLWPRPWEDASLFHTARRSVSNWRQEAGDNLPADWRGRLGFAYGDGQPLPRCVRLNNYWCVKRAGWNGEIAADAEGHVAFASAQEGALVAALLLRRYYVDLKLTSAHDIVSRWAPAQCGPPAAVLRGVSPANLAKVRAFRQKVATQQRASIIRGRNLRAQWLARNRPGFTGARVARTKGLRRSVVRDAAPASMRAPSIAAGMGEVRAVSEPTRLAALDLSRYMGAASKLPPLPAYGCGGEGQRIANYASRLAQGIADKPTDDLKLFDASGEPTPNLATALISMANVEIGPHRIEPALATQAVDDLREAIRLRREAAERARLQTPVTP